MPIKLSTAINLPLFMVLASDHRTGATGKTLTISISKDGAAFAAVTPVVTELANGWYSVAFTATHTDTPGALIVHASASACDPFDELFAVGPVEADLVSINTNTGGATRLSNMVNGYFGGVLAATVLDAETGLPMSATTAAVGTGARTITVNVTNESAAAIEGARVRFSQSGVTRDLATTNSSGTATINVDDGTFLVSTTASSFDGESQTYIVSGNQTLAIELASNAPTAPTDPEQITVYGYTRAGSGEGVPATITFRLRVPANEAGSIYVGQPIQTTSSTLGYFEIDLLRLSQYDVSVDGSGRHVRFTTTDDGSMEMPLAVC